MRVEAVLGEVDSEEEAWTVAGLGLSGTAVPTWTTAKQRKGVERCVAKKMDTVLCRLERRMLGRRRMAGREI
jgi:hypothetical protein